MKATLSSISHSAQFHQLIRRGEAAVEELREITAGFRIQAHSMREYVRCHCRFETKV